MQWKKDIHHLGALWFNIRPMLGFYPPQKKKSLHWGNNGAIWEDSPSSTELGKRGIMLFTLGWCNSPSHRQVFLLEIYRREDSTQRVSTIREDFFRPRLASCQRNSSSGAKVCPLELRGYGRSAGTPRISLTARANEDNKPMISPLAYHIKVQYVERSSIKRRDTLSG